MRKIVTALAILILMITITACGDDMSDAVSTYLTSCQKMKTVKSFIFKKTIIGEQKSGEKNQGREIVSVVEKDGEVMFKVVQRDQKAQIVNANIYFCKGIMYQGATLDGETIGYKYKCKRKKAIRMFNIDIAKGEELDSDLFQSAELKEEKHKNVCIFKTSGKHAKKLIEDNLTNSDALVYLYPETDVGGNWSLDRASVDLEIRVCINKNGYITKQKWIVDINYNKGMKNIVHSVMTIKVKSINKEISFDPPDPNNYEGAV